MKKNIKIKKIIMTTMVLAMIIPMLTTGIKAEDTSQDVDKNYVTVNPGTINKIDTVPLKKTDEKNSNDELIDRNEFFIKEDSMPGLSTKELNYLDFLNKSIEFYKEKGLIVDEEKIRESGSLNENISSSMEILFQEMFDNEEEYTEELGKVVQEFLDNKEMIKKLMAEFNDSSVQQLLENLLKEFY